MRNVHSSILLLTVLLFAAYFNTAAQTSQKPDLSGSQNIINQTPAYFIENKGQWDDAIKFRANLNGTTAFICKNNVVFDFYRLYNEAADVKNEDNRRIQGHAVNLDYSTTARQNFKGLKKLDYFHNYFIGNDSTKWARHVALYQEVIVENFSEGIDARFYFENNMLRYDFIVKPGANLHDLSLKFDMGNGYENSLSINECGELVMKTSLGDIINGQLAAYQLAGVVKRPVDCAFNVETNNQASFVLGEYDRNKELVIDPLVYSTFISSSGNTVGLSIKVNREVDYREVYVCGWTESTTFPIAPTFPSGPYQNYNRGNKDCFISKINRKGDTLVYSTYLGGSGVDIANDLYYDQAQNRIYITGKTNSSNFPIKPDSAGSIFQSNNAGGFDAFITILEPDGTGDGDLIKSTYLGGDNDDEGTGIKYLADSGCVVIVGNTTSFNFPVTGMEGSFVPPEDGFIFTISTNLHNYWGGTFFSSMDDTDTTKLYGLDIGTDDRIYSVGSTKSDGFLPGELATLRIGVNGGGYDCIVSKSHIGSIGLGDSIKIIVFDSTCRLRGTNDEEGKSIKFFKIPADYRSYIFITGYTYSNNFPVNTPNNGFKGFKDAFIARFETDTLLDFTSRLLGKDSCTIEANGITAGGYFDFSIWRAAIIGTLSCVNDTSYIHPYNEVDNSLHFRGGKEAFIAKFPYDLATDLTYFGYLNGSNDEEGFSIDMCKMGELYTTGSTKSGNYQVTNNSYNHINNNSGNVNCFVTKLEGLDSITKCQPEIIYPINNSFVDVSQPDTFKVKFQQGWCPDSIISFFDAGHVEIQLSNDTTFQDSILRFKFDRNNTSDTTFCIIDTGNLQLNQKYYWRAFVFAPVSSAYASDSMSFATNYQTIQLDTGWNLISSYMNPVNDSIHCIMNNINSNIVVMKDGVGNTYVPSYSIDDIHVWTNVQGYQIYMNNSRQLKVIGTKIIPESTAIHLNAGWNMIAYLRDHKAPIDNNNNLGSISNLITVAKNGTGGTWYPQYNYNTIGNQIPGQGYQVYMSDTVTFYYASNSSSPRIPGLLGVVENDSTPLPTYLIPIINTTGNSASIILHCNNIQDSTEIGVWNSNWNLIGSGKVFNGVTAFTIWGDNEATEAVDGALPYENLNIKAYNYQTGRILDLNLSNLHEITKDTFPAHLFYYKDAIFEASAQLNISNTQSYFDLTCLPNPFQGSATISYNLPDDGSITLVITDNIGNIITTLLNNESQNSGSHNITFNSTNIQTGIYFCTLTSGEHTETIQLLIVQ